MAKKITQDYFNTIIKENIDDFEMEPNDALRDAIKQMESQNIDLSMIVKITVDEQEKFLGDLKQIEVLLQQNTNTNEQLQTLSRLKSYFDKDISYRCYATNKVNFLDLFQLAFQNYKHTDGSNVLLSFLQTFNAYINQQNDTLNTSFIVNLIDLIGANESKFDLIDSLLKCISTSCILNEKNRLDYIDNGLCELLFLNFLKFNKFNLNLLNKICVLIRNLLLDDDIRVEFSKSHDNAKFIVTKLNGLDILLNIGLTNKELNAEALGNIMLTLSKLAVRNEYCQEIYDKGGLRFAMKCLTENDDMILIKSSLSLLKSICNNDIVKKEATKLDAVRCIVDIMSKYINNPTLCELCALTLTTILLRNSEACENLVLHDGDLVLMQMLTLHIKVPRVIKACCGAIRNMVSRNKALGDKIINLNIEELLRKILNQNDPYCYDEVKAALRDLDLKVELKELWTGSGRQLAQ